MKKLLLGLSACSVSASLLIATDCYASLPVALPTACIASQFSATGDAHWKEVTLRLTNNCSQPVDFQNASVTFNSLSSVNTAFWGDFDPLPYPDNNLSISSQPSGTNFLATLNLHFPTWEGSTTMLPVGKSIQLIYGLPSDEHVEGSAKVYLSSNSGAGTGTISLKNSTAKPANVNQNYALVHVMMNGQSIQDVQLGWGATLNLNGLATGTYTISPEQITDTAGTIFQGVAAPQNVQVLENQTVTSTVTYTAVQNTGKISIKLQALPAELAGYATSPTVVLTQNSTGSTTSKSVAWDSTATVTALKAGDTYSLATANINYNNVKCAPLFVPPSVVANANTAPVANLTYHCERIAESTATFNVQGAPGTLTSLKITLTPNDNSAPVSQNITLSNGSGSAVIPLTEGVIYTVSADNIAGYTASFSPQPLTATANAVETITFTPTIAAQGRIITYVPGWKTPPAAQSLATAGYTHVMVAFGVFSTTTPGVIVPAFDTVTKAYIDSLHNAGIKVILSLGGASSSIANTSVDFHQVLSAAASPAAFQQTFINSLNGLIAQYGFDGFDIDIEHGINAGGSFSQPQGDIAVLANIINAMHQQHPNLLITLTPQVANISATSGFDQTWGNYASLIMQTHDSLAWVGIQLYNTGCAFGIDLVCYADMPTTPDFSVAMATDLLANWPSMIDNRVTGFQPYISYLKPEQIVLGYPAPDASGNSDGSPAKSTVIIKRAIQCLKTATKSSTSCDTYVPPKAYGAIGGVFNWEATYDQNNNFKFATDLKNCVMNGNCN
ncbi:glycosyl hydrolase family 18 protein [uncultured Legionella sp.]|uniref:glycosyl hydrolase family 18 protein n=1 Tax=uncultured Legionella sp. TaxID=210934 RepID=UPI00262D8901|nr:glycosyl hydrolase family 18 protein [uncultured Legionella sp.]